MQAALPLDADDAPLEQRIVGELPALRDYVRRLASGTRGVDVEDLLQESVARALRYRASFDGGRALGPWLRAVALRVVLDRRSRGARRVQPLSEDVPDSGACATTRHDDRDELSQTLSVLSEVERVVLVRFHARGESVREIATSLGMPEGTVKSHLHRARRRIAAGGST